MGKIFKLISLIFATTFTSLFPQENNLDWVNEYYLPPKTEINSQGFLLNNVFFTFKTEFEGAMETKKVAIQQLLPVSLIGEKVFPSILLSHIESKESYLSTSFVTHIEMVEGNIYVFYEHTNNYKNESKILLKIFNIKGESTNFKVLGTFRGVGFQKHTARFKYDFKSKSFVFLEQKPDYQENIHQLIFGKIDLVGNLISIEPVDFVKPNYTLMNVQDYIYESESDNLLILGRYLHIKNAKTEVNLVWSKPSKYLTTFYEIEPKFKNRITSFQYHYDEVQKVLNIVASENGNANQGLIFCSLNLWSGIFDCNRSIELMDEFAYNSFALGDFVAQPIPANLNVVALFKDGNSFYAVCEEYYNIQKLFQHSNGTSRGFDHYQHFGHVWIYKFSNTGYQNWISYVPKRQRAYNSFNREMGIKTFQTDDYILVFYNDLYWNIGQKTFKKLSEYRGDSRESHTVIAKISKQSGNVERQRLFLHRGLHRPQSLKSIVEINKIRKIDEDRILIIARHPKGHIKFGIYNIKEQSYTNGGFDMK